MRHFWRRNQIFSYLCTQIEHKIQFQSFMKRLYSIDILRGMALAGMILVNNPGSWSNIYAPLEHAEFIGLTPTDMVFPTFMFVMGFCIPLSLRKCDFKASWAIVRRILTRTLLIFAIGLGLQWMSSGWCDWQHLRIPGVLQRLALCYGAVALLALVLKEKWMMSVAVLLLTAYGIILAIGDGYLFSEQNICARVDHWLLGADHLYVDNGIRLDPEGLLSTIPSIAHVMIGATFSLMLLRMRAEEEQKPATNQDERAFFGRYAKALMSFVVTTLIVTICGTIGDMPISKKVWSTMFVLVSISIDLVMLALLMWLVDVKKWKGWWSEWFVTFGQNPLLMYVISWILAHLFGQWGITWGTYQWMAQYLSPCAASLAYALCFVLINWCIAFGLRKANVKLRA